VDIHIRESQEDTTMETLIMWLAPLSRLAQDAGDVLTEPVVVALLSLLAVPVVASAVTTALVRGMGVGIRPESVVYIVCALIVGGLALMAGGVPMVDPANPVATVTAWQVWVAAQTKWTQVLYDAVLVKVWPSDPVPEPLRTG
jgi:DNA-binding transcriptional LysR family regulator